MPPQSAPEGAGDTICVRSTHADFEKALSLLGLSNPPAFGSNVTYPLAGSASLFRRFKLWQLNAVERWESYTDQQKHVVAAVKDTLVAADVAGSALPRVLTS